MPDEVELSPLERLRLALIKVEESRRVVMCRPELEAGVRAAVAELCVREDLIEVRVSPYLPDGAACIWFDPNVIEPSRRQALERDFGWAASLNYPPDPRSAVIITGI